MTTRSIPDLTIKLLGEGPDWLSSIASIVSATAWPAVIVTCLLIFRSELKAILSRVTSIGIGNITAQVDQSLRASEALSAATSIEGAGGDEILQEAPSVSAISSDADAKPPQISSSASEPAEVPLPSRQRRAYPTASSARKEGRFRSYEEWVNQVRIDQNIPIAPRMIQAFDPVQALIRELASNHGIPSDISLEDTISALTGMEVVSNAFGSLLNSQNQLRNLVAHNGGGGISEFQARQYVEQLEDSRRRLEDLLARGGV